MFILSKVLHLIRMLVFAVVLGYMIAWHNVYREDQKMIVDIAITIEHEDEDQSGELDYAKLVNGIGLF